MSDPEMDVDITLEQEEKYRFTAVYDEPEGYRLEIDEPEPHGSNDGPNPARLLATSVGHCLNASLIFCMKKRDVDLEGCSSKVHADLERNENGHWRIQQISVDLGLPNLDEDEQDVLEKCRDRFEEYCLVTESVRQGIPVDVNLQ